MLLFDLSNSNSKEELSNLIGLENQNLIKEMNIEAILNLPILDFNKFAGYSYFILRRESERFFLQVFLEILIPDYKLKSKDLDKINRKLAPLTKIKLKKRPKSKDKGNKYENMDCAFISSSALHTAQEKQMAATRRIIAENNIKKTQKYDENCDEEEVKVKPSKITQEDKIIKMLLCTQKLKYPNQVKKGFKVDKKSESSDEEYQIDNSKVNKEKSSSLQKKENTEVSNIEPTATVDKLSNDSDTEQINYLNSQKEF